ncbi:MULTISPECIES: hypothetical protein [Methylobacterium]|uniref:hypothetical protein n=1 Tax=Methylobacterium TaxID=407 RepID=UPI001050D0DC|nr:MULTISPECIES: hypothetical protein [Methylobacterium]MDR7039241.1 hypothetical protein [Methylobacterium sp. BE186]
MTTLKTRTRRAPKAASRTSRDRSIALIIVFMMGLVFVPVLGLHVAAALGGLDNAPALASAPPATAISAAREARDRRG